MTHKPVRAVAASRVVTEPANHSSGRWSSAPTVRSTEMLLLNEELARARLREAEAEAARARLALRLVAARRWQRRAERAVRRAHLAAAAVI
jgi:hypothetical protein